MKSKILVGLLIFLALWNCQKKENTVAKSEQSNDSLKKIIKDDSLHEKTLSENEAPKVFTDDFLEIENVQVNGNNVIISKNNFEKTYPKLDSIKSEPWECGSPFEWLDKEWLEKTYGKDLVNFDGKITTFYINNAEFNSDNNIVLFNRAQSDKNDFEIKTHHITLNKNTTISEFQKLFPKLKKDETDQKNVVSFRIPVSKDGDDAFIFYFKDGKLESFYLWWLLC